MFQKNIFLLMIMFVLLSFASVGYAQIAFNQEFLRYFDSHQLRRFNDLKRQNPSFTEEEILLKFFNIDLSAVTEEDVENYKAQRAQEMNPVGVVNQPGQPGQSVQPVLQEVPLHKKSVRERMREARQQQPIKRSGNESAQSPEKKEAKVQKGAEEKKERTSFIIKRDRKKSKEERRLQRNRRKINTLDDKNRFTKGRSFGIPPGEDDLKEDEETSSEE